MSVAVAIFKICILAINGSISCQTYNILTISIFMHFRLRVLFENVTIGVRSFCELFRATIATEFFYIQVVVKPGRWEDFTFAP